MENPPWLTYDRDTRRGRSALDHQRKDIAACGEKE